MYHNVTTEEMAKYTALLLVDIQLLLSYTGLLLTPMSFQLSFLLPSSLSDIFLCINTLNIASPLY